MCIVTVNKNLAVFHVNSKMQELLRLGSPSAMCAKLRTVAASNNKVHLTRSLCYCLFARHIYGVVLRAHSVRGEPRIQHNANWEVATTSPSFTTNCTYRTFFLWSLHLARPLHPGYVIHTNAMWTCERFVPSRMAQRAVSPCVGSSPYVLVHIVGPLAATEQEDLKLCILGIFS